MAWYDECMKEGNCDTYTGGGTSTWTTDDPIDAPSRYVPGSFMPGSQTSGWVDALKLASGFLGGGGSSKSGGSTNVDKGGYLNQAKKEAKQEASMKKVFDNFSIYEPSWEPQSSPQQFAQQYAGGMSGGGGGSSSGGSTLGRVAGGAASGALAGAQIGARGGPTGMGGGALLGGVSGLFCDVRLKTDIAPLERSDVHDELAEMAFLVKEIRECA